MFCYGGYKITRVSRRQLYNCNIRSSHNIICKDDENNFHAIFSKSYLRKTSNSINGKNCNVT